MTAIKKQSNKKCNGKKPTAPAKKKAPAKATGKTAPVKKQADNKQQSKTQKANVAQKKPTEPMQEQRVLIEVLIKTHNDNNGGHPHVMMDEIQGENKDVSVGLTTHQFKGKNHPNIRLEKDPLDRKDKSYMRRTGTVDNKRAYHSPKQGTMTANDYKKAQKIANTAKSGYIAKQNKNKK